MNEGVFSYVCMAANPDQGIVRIESEPPKHWAMRGWDAAETNRLNRDHWRKARGQPINEDLASDLFGLRARCDHEAQNNPTVEGVIRTHQTDIVGQNGPTLRVICDSEEYSKKLEAGWKEWFERPTLHPRRSGVTVMNLWISNLWKKGEFIFQKITDMRAPGPVKFRINPIHPNRLATPPNFSGDPNVVLGVRVTSEGIPTQYYIADQKRQGAALLGNTNFTPVPADLLIHSFIQVEDDQQRGVPWLASSLDSIGHGRDYERHVLEAAKNHAAQSVFFFTRHPESQYYEVNEHTTLEPGTASTCPPGWEPWVTPPTQPGSQYFEYLKERQREIGRGVAMPLMAIRLDSSEHNYSSARFDGQVYLRSLKSYQGWLARETLNELVNEVARELELAGVLPKKPADVRYQWIWAVPPHVDPLKEANAERTLMENGTLPYSDAVAAHGRDVDDVIEQRKTDNARLIAAGLPKVPEPVGVGRPPNEDPNVDPNEDKDPPVPKVNEKKPEKVTA